MNKPLTNLVFMQGVLFLSAIIMMVNSGDPTALKATAVIVLLAMAYSVLGGKDNGL